MSQRLKNQIVNVPITRQNSASSDDAEDGGAVDVITVDRVENLNPNFFLNVAGSEEKENGGENIHFSD